MGDGNYRLVREMNGNKDPEDVSLSDGNLYFVKWEDFEEYLKVASLQPEEVTYIHYCLWSDWHMSAEVHM